MPNVSTKGSRLTFFTDPYSLRPLTGIRTLPIVADTPKPSLGDRIKEALHSSSEYGPADPKDLKLTDPRTLRPLGERSAVAVDTGKTQAHDAGTTNGGRVKVDSPATVGMATGTAPVANIHQTTSVPTTPTNLSAVKPLAAVGATAGAAATIGSTHPAQKELSATRQTNTAVHSAVPGKVTMANPARGNGVSTLRPESTGHTTMVPDSYNGPIPQVGPGEEIWWKTTTTTTYYDDDGAYMDVNGDVADYHHAGVVPNAYGSGSMVDGQHKRKSGFFSRLFGKRNGGTGKGKQRV